ncbi:tape measure protein [Leuconostoc mesenteroides]|uniref:tape measure protein n=1 Tax=Leuconostoc mesenteroides TaxID=1245 RepID=UPI001CBE4DFF|nr:tape measure protein [Leuconostoc mesenteroides]MBZ1517635.1 tape measure protein [Leuconostoc mesenteroides]MBZ1520344.1 tape measure protein [Leuconostoc mesenteroides]
MAKQIVNEMATNLTLDSNSASQALKELTREVKNSSAEAKIMESQYKASGDAVSASKAKYEGLQSTLEAQKTKIEALKNGLDNVNTSTKKGQDLQQYLNGELAKAERQYASYQGQLEKATQSYKYQESGLASLNDELKHSNSLTDARVQKLEAEGRTEEANKVKLEGLKNTQENYTKQLEIQKAELNKLAETGDKNTDSYKRQELRVEQMGAKLASTTSDIKHFNNTDIKPETKGLTSVKDKLNSLNDSLEGTRSHFKTIFMGNLIANGVTNALSSIKSHITGVIQAGIDYDKEMQNIQIGLDNFTGGNKELAGKLLENIKGVKEESGYATDTVALLTKKTYGLTQNTDDTKKLSDAFVNLGRATGMSDDGMKGLITKFSQANASGEITSGSITKLNKQLPGFADALAKSMGKSRDDITKMAGDGKLKMDDLAKAIETMSDAKPKGLENYYKTVDGFTNHFEERYKSLSGKITEGFFTQSNTMLAGLSKSLDGKEVDKSFNRIGDSANKAVNTVVKAFSSSFSGSKTNPVADMANFTANSIEKLGNWVAKHADDIKDFFTMVKELGATGFSTMGTTLKIALPLLEDLGKFASKHPTTFKVLAGSILGLNLALKATLSTMAVFGKTKAVFGALSGLIIKPKVDGSSAKRELGILGKAGKGIGKAFWWTGKLAVKSVLKSLELIGDATIKTGKALWWTAKLATKVFLKSLELLGGAVIKSGKAIGKGLVFTAKIATKGAKLAMAGLVKTAKVTGRGIKLAFNFLKANPLILLVTAITAVVIAFAELYKHNKKFRKFVNDLVKSAQQFFKGIGKWFGQAYKTIMNFFKDILNFVKKDWKEILLFIVNPFAGAFALVYKHNAKFRKAVNNLVKDVVNFFKNMGKSIGDIFNSIFKNVSKIYNSIKDFIGDTTHNIYKGWVNSWKSIFNFFGDTWNNIKKFGSNSINSLKGTFDDVLGKIGRSFSNTWNGIKDGFRAMWDGMKQLAGDGINAVIRIPNAGIDGINGLIHDFGGSKNALGKIPRVRFANGTGAIQELTHAVLNDGNDSPETGNKETLIHPNGKMEIVQGQNTERLLLPGTEVLNARETAMFMGLQGVKHFAGGTGFWSKLLSGAGNAVSNIAGSAWAGLKNGVDKFTKMFSYITGAVADPSGTLGKVLNLKSGGVSSVMDGVAGGAYKKVTSTAKDWWSTLWSMASESSSSGTGSKGDDYAFKNKSKDSGVDPWGYFYRECVSFIASRLKNLGVSESLFSHLGNGADWVNAKVPHSNKPKVGDVAVYAAGSEFGNHASIVTGVQGDKISGEEYNWSGDGQYHTYNGRRASGATTFLDFGRSAGAKAKEVATNSPLARLIKKQTGGMMSWIQKFIAPINDSSTGADNDVQSWSGDVKKALSKLGLSTSGSMVSKVLKQIQTESGGNAKARGGNDGLADGNATGLMQVKPGTFRAYALHGHNNIMNGYDNILAGLNYAKHRYGDSLSFLGHGHGYANGGLITKHQIAEIGEGNQPEMIIPLDGMKRSRGFELLGKTAVAMASRDGLTSSSATSDNSDVINQLKQAVELLTQLVQGQGNPVPVNVALDKNDWYKKQASDVNLRDYQSLA